MLIEDLLPAQYIFVIVFLLTKARYQEVVKHRRTEIYFIKQSCETTSETFNLYQLYLSANLIIKLKT